MQTRKIVVECCNKDCVWKGFNTDCVTFKHDTNYLMCPECHEVVESITKQCKEGEK
jgi:hypothetical protein